MFQLRSLHINCCGGLLPITSFTKLLFSGVRPLVEGLINLINESLYVWETFPIVLPDTATGKIIWSLGLTLSVTRLLDYLFIFGHLQQ